MTSLLIIGGSGFFGKSFVDYYNEKSFKKWGIDKLLITSRTEQIIGGHKTIQYDSKNFKFLEEVDYIIYAASTTDSKTYNTNYKNEIASQKKGMINFQRLINGYKNPPKILYTSSGAVYGQTNLNNYQTDELITEPKPDDNNEIKKVYANIKLEWEQCLLDKYPNQTLIARCFAFVGSRLPLNKHFVIGNFINNYINNEEIVINSPFAVYRSYLYADDLVEWLLSILVKGDPTENKIFNVGSDQEIEIHDLANIFKDLSGNKRSTYLINYEDFNRYVPNIELAKKIFNLPKKDIYKIVLEQNNVQDI